MAALTPGNPYSWPEPLCEVATYAPRSWPAAAVETGRKGTPGPGGWGMWFWQGRISTDPRSMQLRALQALHADPRVRPTRPPGHPHTFRAQHHRCQGGGPVRSGLFLDQVASHPGRLQPKHRPQLRDHWQARCHPPTRPCPQGGN